jgi:asparagine synthase (glutamine-hydrolysing)
MLGLNSINSYTIGFDSPSGQDEMAKAAVLADKFGTEHHELVFGEADFWAYLPKVAGYFDDPVADYAVLPTWKLAAEASRSLKVVLCGEGGDEVFAGYGRYKNRPIKSILRRLRGKPRYALSEAETLKQFRLFKATDDYTPLQIRQIRDIIDYLPNDLLLKLDNCLMAHGLEGRTPLLDKQIMAFGFSLPDRLKMSRGTGKLLLKTWVDRHAPEARAFGRKKGFTVPVGYWIEKKADKISELLSHSEAIRKYARDINLKELFANPAKGNALLCWRLMYFAAWHRLHVEAPGAGPDYQGDFFQLLDESAG